MTSPALISIRAGFLLPNQTPHLVEPFELYIIFDKVASESNLRDGKESTLMEDKNMDEVFMKHALQNAETALKQGWIPVGAVFVKDHRIVAHGTKSGMVHPLFDHAEHNGCYQSLWSREGPKNLRGMVVYTTLEPCVMCMSMLMTTRVSKIVYGLEDPYGGGSFILDHPDSLPERFREERPMIYGSVLRQESKKLLKLFFEKNDPNKSRGWSKDNSLSKLALS